MRKTKVICTIGPASDDADVLAKMCESGMDVARLNFSHGTHEEHQVRIDMIKSVREKLDYPLPIMLDTKGPEYRVGDFRNGKEELKEGQEFTFTIDDVVRDNSKVSVSYKGLVGELECGDTILVNNGLLIFKVKKLTDRDAICEVQAGGEISNRKSMSFPGHVFKVDYLSQKDKEDLLFGIKNDIDFVAASFVSNKQDITDLREFLDENGGSDIEIIAKIENQSGVDNVEEICEISDVANAVYDGSSAIMLSGESAAGKYPVEAVKNMAEIAEYTENNIDYIKRFAKTDYVIQNNIDALSHATCQMAIDTNAKGIVISSMSGLTVKMVSRFRCPIDILGMTTSKKACRQLNLSWGVTPVLSKEFESVDEMFDHATTCAKEIFDMKKGENIVLTGGTKSRHSGNSNTIRLESIID